MKWLWQYFEYWFGLSWALNFSVKLLGYVSCHPYAAGITCSADRVVLHTSCLRGLGKKKHCLNGFWSVEWNLERSNDLRGREREGGGGAAGCSHLHRFGRVRDDGHDHLCLRRGLDLNFFFFCKELKPILHILGMAMSTLYRWFLYGRNIQLLPVGE